MFGLFHEALWDIQLQERENRQWLTTTADCPQSLTKALFKKKKKQQQIDKETFLKTKSLTQQHGSNMFITHWTNDIDLNRSQMTFCFHDVSVRG